MNYVEQIQAIRDQYVGTILVHINPELVESSSKYIRCMFIMYNKYAKVYIWDLCRQIMWVTTRFSNISCAEQEKSLKKERQTWW